MIDLRWTLRSLRRAPGFTIVFVAVAALGIGATTTAFTLLNHVLIRPLPFPRPDELVALQQTWRAAGDRRTDMAPANLEHWRTMNHSFDAVGGYASRALRSRSPAAASRGASTRSSSTPGSSRRWA